jgi:hypothetical protein
LHYYEFDIVGRAVPCAEQERAAASLLRAADICLRSTGVDEVAVRDIEIWRDRHPDVSELFDGVSVSRRRGLELLRHHLLDEGLHCQLEGPGGVYAACGQDWGVHVAVTSAVPRALEFGRRLGFGAVEVEERSPFVDRELEVSPYRPATDEVWSQIAHRAEQGETLAVIEVWAWGALGSRLHIITGASDVPDMIRALKPRAALMIARMPAPLAPAELSEPFLAKFDEERFSPDDQVRALRIGSRREAWWECKWLYTADEIRAWLRSKPTELERLITLRSAAYAGEVDRYVLPDPDGVVRSRLGSG